ncbi:MAG: hypothetical protein SO256_01870 [Gemmiger sp.]|uniref:hypothetical protein n=1 Tax=Gemmiger sp. TaxID=2049027 RepID=UPI002A81F666|nr:hypothetical protein [Gemmiger sp.]MDY4772476.1 hypothetical protein [Gemmiger sp.]MDY5202468.1 hypothetical protein [Gemmiger sp.]
MENKQKALEMAAAMQQKSLQTITTPSLPEWTVPMCYTTKKIQERKLLYRS